MPRFLFSLLAVFGVAVSATALGAQTFHIDPVNGADVVGGGSVVAPFRTMTFALQQPLGRLPVLALHPGRYSALNGEHFPLSLPEFCQLERAGSAVGEVILDGPAGVDLLRYAPGGAGALRLCDLRVHARSAGNLLRISLSSSAYALVEIADCQVSGSAGVEVQGGRGSGLDLLLTGVDIDAGAAPAALHLLLSADATARLQADRCSFSGGAAATVDLDARFGGLLRANLRSCRIVGGGSAGVRAASGSLTVDLNVRLEHCLLRDHGLSVAGGAGLLGAGVAGSVPPSLRVVNSVFDGNARDVVPGPAQVSYGVNLVGQQDLVGLGGNFVGTPGFIDVAQGLDQLRPDSPLIDRGRAYDTTLWVDLDGEPRVGGAAPDLGPDELHRHAVVGSRRVQLGQTLELAVTTLPGVAFGLLAGSDRVAGSFGAGSLHLAGSWVGTSLAGVADPGGVGRVQIVVPSEVSLQGVDLHWQAVVAAAPWLGANAWTTRLQR